MVTSTLSMAAILASPRLAGEPPPPLTCPAHSDTLALLRRRMKARRATQRGGPMLHWIKRIGSTLLALAFTLTTGTAYAQGTIKPMHTAPRSRPLPPLRD